MRTGTRAEEHSLLVRSSEKSVTRSAAPSMTHSTSSERRNETTRPTESGPKLILLSTSGWLWRNG